MSSGDVRPLGYLARPEVGAGYVVEDAGEAAFVPAADWSVGCLFDTISRYTGCGKAFCRGSGIGSRNHKGICHSPRYFSQGVEPAHVRRQARDAEAVEP